MAEIPQFDINALLTMPAEPREAPAAPASAGGEALQLLTDLEDVRTSVRRAAGRAQRLMSIYTADLEPDVYDQPAFLEIIKRFVLGRSFAKVRVLLHQPLRLIGNSNRFVAMSRRLSSYIEIRVVAAGYGSRHSAMFIADDNAIVYRTRTDSWNGVAGFNQPQVARVHLADFDEMWTASAPDRELRAAHR